MSANVLLNLLNKLGKRDKSRGLPFFRNVYPVYRSLHDISELIAFAQMPLTNAHADLFSGARDLILV